MLKSAVLALALAGCSAAASGGTVAGSAENRASLPQKTAPAVDVAAAVVEPSATPLPAVSFDGQSWVGFGVASCSYLAPAGDDFIGPDGAIDVVWHFHAGQMASADMKSAGIRAVFVSCGYGIGTGLYSSTFEDPNRFGAMMKSLVRTVGSRAHRPDTHLGRLALASWSAGFAAVNRILGVPEWYAKTDAVMLFDSLHAQYIDLPKDARLKTKPVQARGADHVDTNMLRRFIRFAGDAAHGQKTMVITHSSILPPDYASTTEATAALLDAIDVRPSDGIDATPFGLPSMAPSVVVDAGNLHVRGFRGNGPHDHFDHLHLIGNALRSWLVPAWYSQGSERH